jgi:TP901 family phage tail tape measure protein
MLRKLQTELRATARALLKMGETAAASALGHTAMAMDRVQQGATKAASGVKQMATSTGEAAKKIGKLRGETEKQAAISKKLSPALQKSLGEINKQKAALVASGRAITTHVSSQELFARTNQVLASGLHRVSGTLTDYDNSMAKSLGRSPAFRSEVNKIAGAVGKQGEAFKNQFTALTKVDNVWRDHVTTMRKAGIVTTGQATKMYDAYSHLGLSAKELQARIKASNGELINAATYNKAAREELTHHTKAMTLLGKKEGELAALSGKSIGIIQKETEASMKRTKSFEAVTAGIDKQVAAYKAMDKHQAKVVKGEQALAKATGARIGKIQEITTRMRAQGASYADIGKHLDTLKAKHAANTTQMGKVAKASDSLRKSNKQLAGEIDALGRIRIKNLAATQASAKSLEGLARKYPQLSKQVAILSQKVAAGNMPLASADKILHKLRSGMGQTTTKASLLSRAMSSLVSHLKSFASYAAAATIIGGIAAIFGSATNAIIKYDQALHDLQAITRATDAEVGLMGEKIREIGRTTKFSASEVAVAMRTLGQAGFTAREAIESIGDVANLATGTLTSMKIVVDLVTTAIRAFDMKATETGRVADIFANAVNRSKLTIDKLRIAFNYIGPIAAKTGISLEETATTTMMLANAGIRASTIGTGLRRTFQQLIDPTKELKAAIEAAGYTVEDFNPQMNDMRDIVRRLTEIVPDAEAAFRMFSLRSSAAVAALSSQGVASFDALNSAVLRSGTAAAMAEKQIEGLGIIFKQAWDKAQDLALAFGEAGVTGALRVFGKGLQAVFDGLRIFVSSGIGKAVIAVGSFSLGLLGIVKIWGLLKFSVWGQSILFFAKQLLFAKTAGEALNVVGNKLNMTFIYLAAAVAVAYGAYKIYNSVLADISKVSTRYIDDLDKIHREELERLENVKRLVSITRDEMETNRGRSKALIELSKEGARLNLVLNEEADEVENLTETILDNKDALDKWAQAFDDYSEKAKIENLEAQAKLFEKTEEAIKRTTSSMTYWNKMSKKFTTETAQGLARLPILGGLVSGAFLLMRKRVDACREANEALESQQGEAYEKMVTAVTAFGDVTQEVWKKYMLQAGASEEAVAKLFTDSKEKITQAHLEAYIKIQLAREDMTKAEKVEMEKHLKLVGDLFGRIYSTTARMLEKDLIAVRKHYSERGKVAAEFYSVDSLYLRGKLGYEAGVYGKLLGLARRFGTTRLTLLKQQYEEERALIKGRDLGMVKEQEKLAENDKKYANRKLALEKEIAEELRTLAEEQLEMLAKVYERTATAYDESVDQRIDSVNKYYDYEKARIELQGERSKLVLSDAVQYAEKAVAVEASSSLRKLGIENEYISKKKNAAKILYSFEREQAQKLVDLEVRRFNELVALGEQAKNDRLANEESYHKEQAELIETAREALVILYTEDNEKLIEEEKKLNDELVEIDRASIEKRLAILTDWSNQLSGKYSEAIGNTREYANKIISLENEIRTARKKTAEEITSATATTEDQVLRIRRAKMTKTQLLWSKVREAYKKMVEANRLVSKVGTVEALKQAKILYGEAQSIYGDLGVQAANAEKKGKDIGISYKAAITAVKSAGEGTINVLKALEQASIAAKQAEISVAEQAQTSWANLAEEIKQEIDGIQTDVEDLIGFVDDMVSSIGSIEDKEVSIGADETYLKNSIRLVNNLWTNICKLKDKVVTITTRHIETGQASGGVVGGAYSQGGVVGAAYARGGSIPGVGSTDKIEALLAPQEYVIRRESAIRYGTEFLDQVNSGTYQPSNSKESGRERSYNFNINIGNANLAGKATKSVLDRFQSELRRQELVRGIA